MTGNPWAARGQPGRETCEREAVSGLAGALYFLTLGDYDLAEEHLEGALKWVRLLRKRWLEE